MVLAGRQCESQLQKLRQAELRPGKATLKINTVLEARRIDGSQLPAVGIRPLQTPICRRWAAYVRGLLIVPFDWSGFLKRMDS